MRASGRLAAQAGIRAGLGTFHILCLLLGYAVVVLVQNMLCAEVLHATLSCCMRRAAGALFGGELCRKL